MPPIFPANYSYPRHGHLLSFPKQPTSQKDKDMIHTITDKMIDIFINDVISHTERRELESITYLSLVDLVKPATRKHRTKIPRAQNVFVIFRKDQQARLISEKGPDFVSKLNVVSKCTSGLWKQASHEQKAWYDRISLIAKKVHKKIWPNYSYRPNRRSSTALAIPPPPSTTSRHFPTSSSTSSSFSPEAPLPQHQRLHKPLEINPCLNQYDDYLLQLLNKYNHF